MKTKSTMEIGVTTLTPTFKHKTDELTIIEASNFLKFSIHLVMMILLVFVLSLQSLVAAKPIEASGLGVMEPESTPEEMIKPIADVNLSPATPSVVEAGELVSRRFDRTKDILIAQFDNKPDGDDIHSQAALACILAHPDSKGIKFFAVAGAYGTQSGKYINSNSLFTLAYGAQNTNWTDANADRAASVTRIVAKVKPILQAGGWVWVQEAGQSDITADWIASLIAAGITSATVKTNVIVVQHSDWNEGSTTGADLTYVKKMTTYASIDDGNDPIGDYTNSPKRLALTPDYETIDKTYKTEALAVNNPNKTAKALWAEATDIIVASGFNPSYSSISKGGVDFSDCVENWYILGLGDEVNSTRKFWNKYVVNSGTSAINADLSQKSASFSINQVSNGIIEIENPFSSSFNVQIRDMKGQLLSAKSFGNQLTVTVDLGVEYDGIVIVQVSNGVHSSNKKVVIR